MPVPTTRKWPILVGRDAGLMSERDPARETPWLAYAIDQHASFRCRSPIVPPDAA
jgi:hypothetical protein